MENEKDLILWSRAGQWNLNEVKVVLPNIQGQRYTLGPTYPGEREGEEFIFCRHYKSDPADPDPTDGAIISVDDQGLYWIQNDTRNVEVNTRRSLYNIFVNGERLEALEIRRIKSGDKVSLGDPNTVTRPGPGLRGHGHLNFCVKESVMRVTGGSQLQPDNDNEGSNTNNVTCSAESPLTNNLILAEIMKYLPVKDLKSARLVSKMWREEASKPLEKRGKVSITFKEADYEEDHEIAIRVFRYLHEMRDLNMRNLHIRFEPRTKYLGMRRNGEECPPSQKMVDDLRKMLKSFEKLSSLLLQANIEGKADLLLLSTIFQEIGGKLVELTLDGALEFFPEVIPQLPPFTNLKKFAHDADVGERVRLRWVSLLVPLFCQGLESFSCTDISTAKAYLQAFLKEDMPKLRGIAIEGCQIRKESLTLLLQLKNALNSLKFVSHLQSMEELELLEKLLSKHSKTLQTLQITVAKGYNFPGNRNLEVRFPSFPNLEELELQYSRRMRISWDTGLDYEAHFASLRKITVRPPQPWAQDDPVFNALFPENAGGLRSETVKEVWIPVLPNPRHPWYRSFALEFDLQPRMVQIRAMFPTARKINFFL